MLFYYDKIEPVPSSAGCTEFYYIHINSYMTFICELGVGKFYLLFLYCLPMLDRPLGKHDKQSLCHIPNKEM
jgi:hypothetical protein